jgi:hypothetical protein
MEGRHSARNIQLFLIGGGFGGEFLGKRIVGALLVPQDADNPPTAAVVEQLNAIDAASERRFSGSATGLVAAEDLCDVSESFDAIHDGALKKGVLQEIIAGSFGVVLDAHRADPRGAIGVLGSGGEARLRQKQGAKAVPVAWSGRTGDHAVEGRQDAVDGIHVIGARLRKLCGECDGSWRGRLLRRGRSFCGRRLSSSRKRKSNNQKQRKKSAFHGFSIFGIVQS